MDPHGPPALVPELDVTDVDAAVAFYELLGFSVAYARPGEGFAYLECGRVHLMVQTAGGPGRRFRTAPLERPFGRGVNLQIAVDRVEERYERLVAAGVEPVVPLEDRWYRTGEVEVGNRQFVVADPDGYLVRPFEDLGSRPAPG